LSYIYIRTKRKKVGKLIKIAILAFAFDETSSKGMQREKKLLQLEPNSFINQVPIVVKFRGRFNPVEEELRLVDEMKVQEHSDLTKVVLATLPAALHAHNGCRLVSPCVGGP